MPTVSGAILWAVLASASAAGEDPKPEPKGSYVEFDMRPLPCDRGGWHLKIKVDTERVTYEDELGTGGPSELSDLCGGFVRRMEKTGFKAEVVDKSKIRVYGHTKDGKFYPATKGRVDSPDLKKEELPKVKQPGKEG